MPSYCFKIKIAVEILAKIGIIVIVEGLGNDKRAGFQIERRLMGLSEKRPRSTG